MLTNILGMLILIALVIAFAWLFSRALRARNLIVRWVGIILSGLLTLLLAAVTVMAGIGLYKMNVAPYNYSASLASSTVSIPATGGVDVKRGQRLAAGCAGCHSSTGNLPLDGSKDNMLSGGPPAGVLYAPNLTPAGPLKDWTDGEIMRAIREGVDKNGRPLMIMPAPTFHAMSDQDVQDIVAYLRSQPAVDHPTPPRNMNLLAAVFIGSGLFPTSAQPPITQPVAAPQPGTPQYGAYLVGVSGCKDCHGQNLTGGASGGFAPSGPNIAAIVPNWTEAQFLSTIRTGVDPNGHQLSDAMPWKDFNKMFTDSDLSAIYQYLHDLGPATNPSK